MKRYYKVCLFSPLWLPVVVGLIAYIVSAIDRELYRGLPDWLAALGGILIFSLLMGGVQYCVALWIVWTRVDFESLRSWLVGIFWLPIIFTPIQVIGILLFLGGNLNGFEDWWSVGLMAGLDLLVGYGYVLIWLLGLGLIRVFQVNRKVAVI